MQEIEQAITEIKKPCVILAGAGTGKTTTIVKKIKYLVENKIFNPEKIVCITFSNEAANNLLSKIRNSLSYVIEKEPIIKTFHAFSSYLLREHGKKINLDESFKVLTPEEAKIMLCSNLKVLPNDCHKYVNKIGKAKDLGIMIEDIENYIQKKNNNSLEELRKKIREFNFKFCYSSNVDKKEIKEIQELTKIFELKKFLNVFISYEKIKKKENYLDYADLNILTLKLLRENPQIKEEFDYIIVDEFQDTNKIQLELIFSIVKKDNITIVGDLNQSIYRFRGAYKENFFMFKKYFRVSEGEIYTLDRSYRSPNRVLRLAHKLITKNYSNEKECFFVKNVNLIEGEKVKVYKMKNNLEEARKCLEIIKKEIANGKKLEEICLIYRTHAQAQTFRKVFEINNIPYFIPNGNSLLEVEPIKLTISFLKVIEKIYSSGKYGAKEWWDLFYLHNFSEEDLIKIGSFFHENKNEKNLSDKILKEIENLQLSEEGKIKIKLIFDKIRLILLNYEKNLLDLIKETYRILGFFDSENLTNYYLISNTNKFLELAKEFSKNKYPSLDLFLDYLMIIKRLNIEIAPAKIEESGVRLMSAHATKGLEYDVVIMTNLVNERFPIKKKNNFLIPLELYPDLKNSLSNLFGKERENFIEKYETENNLFDERRLCYVAFTRAREKLYLLFAEEYSGKKFSHSLFLDEIDFKKSFDVDFLVDNEERYQEIIETNKNDKNFGLVSAEYPKNLSIFDKNKYFSPSALITFKECQKKFEYKYVFNMPDKQVESWESIKVGSFVHIILERGVKNKFKSLKEFIDLAKDFALEEEWRSLDLEEVLYLIKVFYERNKNKFNDKSLTEYKLFMEIENLKFLGVVDRVDYLPDDSLEIIDYKTGKTKISNLHRNWQLGYYVLAASKLGRVRKITLETLKFENSLEFEVKNNGVVVNIKNGKAAFNVYDVKRELVETTRAVLEASKTKFKACPLEKNCEFCNEYVYRNRQS